MYIIIIPNYYIIFSSDKDSFSFTWLLHTYFSVPDISKVTISGLGGLTYSDKVNNISNTAI